MLERYVACSPHRGDVDTHILLGLRVAQHYGNFYEGPTSDLILGTFDADKAISVSLEHTGTLNDSTFAFLQSAVLHTTAAGQRRVRVCNVGLQVASLAGSVFRYADMEAVVSHMVREGQSVRWRLG